jgi:hypothetical protein
LPASIGKVTQVSVLVGTLVGLAYPVFVLIWFLRPSIARKVREWRNLPPAGY